MEILTPHQSVLLISGATLALVATALVIVAYVLYRSKNRRERANVGDELC